MAQGTPVTWEVTGIVQNTEYGLNGTAIPGKNVEFKTSSGYSGSLFIADTVFKDMAAVQQAIAGEVRAVTAAMAARGTVEA